ncbi:MAG: response regulator [Kiritimatiellae bacterium]|nr:response regulator [Kiritimatiellia bacterium]
MRTLNILVVDDEPVSAKVMKSYLTQYGTCDVATSGLDAVRQVEAFLRSKSAVYDLICLDINMPGMDGHEVLKNIRALEEDYEIQPSDKARVIMTTLMDDASNVTRAFLNQCEIYLVKPIRRKELLKQLVNLGLIDVNEAGG